MLEVLFIFTKAFNENLNWVTVAKEEYLVVEESEGSNGKMPFWRGCWSQGWVQTGELTNNLSKTKLISPPSKQKISLPPKPIQTKKTPRKQTKNSSKTPQNKQKATKEIKTQRKTWNPTKAVLRSQAYVHAGQVTRGLFWQWFYCASIKVILVLRDFLNVFSISCLSLRWIDCTGKVLLVLKLSAKGFFFHESPVRNANTEWNIAWVI